MKNTNTERILHALETHPKASTRDIARITKLREHVVRYTTHVLEQEGQIRRIPLVDVYPLGYQHYGCYFSVAAQQKEKAKAFIAALLKSHHVAWLAEIGGDFQYALAIIAKSPRDLIYFFDEFSERFGDIFFTKSIAPRIAYTQFNHKYLNPGGAVSETTFGDTAHAQTLDGIDHHILIMLTKEPTLTLPLLAKKLKTPLSTIKYRIQKLEEKRIISGYVYDINRRDANMQQFSLCIHINGGGKQLAQDLYAFARNHPHILYFLQCIGEWDFEIGAEVEKSEDIIAISQSLYKEFGTKLVSIKILPIFRYLKLSYYPF